MKFLIGIFLLFFTLKIIYAQEFIENYERYKPEFIKEAEEKGKPVFQKLETEVYIKNNCNDDNVDYYPLNTGDFWEYIEEDTTTFFDFNRLLKFSNVREVIGDTIMPNGISYKKIKEGKYCNSTNEQPVFSYQRKDSTNKIFIYYNSKDTLLFDYPFKEYTFCSSPYSGKIWNIDKKYNVIGFGDTLKAIDIYLLDTLDWNFEYNITLVENIGIVSYKGRPEGKAQVEGKFFGGIIKDSTYGYLLAKRQKIDWSEFYPLHVGDYWVYEGISGSIPYTFYHRVIGDKIMPDGNKYYSIDGSVYERVDSLGNICRWSSTNKSATRMYSFSSIVGDTFPPPNLRNTIWRVEEKTYYEIKRFLYPDLTYWGEYYAKGIGLYYWTVEGGNGRLKGAYINGILYGDTTITDVKFEDINAIEDFNLFQNYPNPFNSTTQISYQLNESSNIRIIVYDTLGNTIVELYNGRQEAGRHEVTFDADKYKLSSGTYYVQLTTPTTSLVSKAVLIK